MINKLEKRETKLSTFISGEYNQSIFIYDTDKYNEIPTKLKFISEEIEEMILFLKYNQTDDYFTLLDLYESSGDGKVFERIMHILLGNKKVEFIKERNIICKGGNSFVYEKSMVDRIVDLSELEPNQPYYIDLSSYPTFPGIDGLLIDEDGIAAVQMTIQTSHNIKDNIIVFLSVYIYYCYCYQTLYKKHHDFFKKQLSDRYEKDKNKVAKSLYNFGYLPDETKYEIIYGDKVKKMNKGYSNWNYESIMKEISEKINMYRAGKLNTEDYCDLERMIRLECYV